MRISETQRLQWLSPEELQRLHQGTCDLLSQTGVKVTHEQIADILVQHGAQREDDRILIPQNMLEQALETTAKNIAFEAPDPKYSFSVDASENEVRFGTGGQALYMVSKTGDTWERRNAGGEDLERILSLCDTLDSVDFVTRPVECDVPEDHMDVEKAKLFKKHCSKPMNLANLVKPARLGDIVDIIGNRSYLSFIVCLVASPLTMDTSAGDRLLALLEKDFPIALSSCPQGGSTAPFSEVGELLQLNAELLFGFVLANAVRPGAKILYRGIPITSDLYSDGSPRWCQPDSIRRVALAAQLSRFYNVPCCGTAGVSDEAYPSAQGITEKVLSWTYEAASGAHYINSAVGMLHQVMSVSLYQYVIDDIGLKQVKKALSEHAEQPISETAVRTALKVLDDFGIATDTSIEQELFARTQHIEKRMESYSEESIEKNLRAIKKAVSGTSGSNVFMKGARKGLREGYLYSGKHIDTHFDVSEIEKRLQSASIL
ncbi:MAG: trimethylamine methyltransferase family protein [Spirochaetota bacterium]